MSPKPKRSSQTRTRSSAKRAHVTELIETRPGLSDQQQPATYTEQPLMAVNMQALSASICTAVQQAVAEAMNAQCTAALSQETQSSTDQSVSTFLAEITQGTPAPSPFQKAHAGVSMQGRCASGAVSNTFAVSVARDTLPQCSSSQP